jgi:hypothetical protein
VPAFKQVHHDLNCPGQMPLQAALAEFIEMGHFSSALRRSRQSHAERRHCLLQALAPVLSEHSDGPRITGAEQGLHLCLRLPSRADDRALAQRLAQQGITVRPLSAYCLARPAACASLLPNPNRTKLAQAKAALHMPAPNPKAQACAQDFMARVARVNIQQCPVCQQGRLGVVQTLAGAKHLPNPFESGARKANSRAPPAQGP